MRRPFFVPAFNFWHNVKRKKANESLPFCPKSYHELNLLILWYNTNVGQVSLFKKAKSTLFAQMK